MDEVHQVRPGPLGRGLGCGACQGAGLVRLVSQEGRALACGRVRGGACVVGGAVDVQRSGAWGEVRS